MSTNISSEFVKDEPHKLAKALEGRWRLIIASALPVQVVWHMCFAHMNKLLNASVYQTPNVMGLVMCYGGWREFLAHVQGLGMKISKDLSGWDVNSPGWVFRADLELRYRLCKNPSRAWWRVTRWLYEDAFHSSKLIFSNGYVYQQQFWGFMKSGVYNTISTNSAAMQLLHVAASLRAGVAVVPQYAVGDDTIQSEVTDRYIEELEKLGCRVKSVEKGVEFVGTNFGSGKPVPLYFSKHVLSVCSTADSAATIDAFCRLYCHSDRYDLWDALARELDVPVHSRKYYQYWYDSPMASMLGWG